MQSKKKEKNKNTKDLRGSVKFKPQWKVKSLEEFEDKYTTHPYNLSYYPLYLSVTPLYNRWWQEMGFIWREARWAAAMEVGSCGNALMEMGVLKESLGIVLLVVRPLKEMEDN